NCVRLADGPALDKHRHGRQILRIALRGSVVRPSSESLLFCRSKTAFVQERAWRRFRMPWRHRAKLDAFADRARVWARLFVSQQRHGSNLTRAVTGDAIPV